jgi:carbamoyltransferase
MLLVAPVAKEKLCPVDHEPEGIARIDVPRSLVPSCTHVDGSARVQTVARVDNPVYFDLLSAFERRTGVPVLVNTSFNVRGEPIVCTPDDAVRCFLATEIDVLVMEGFTVRKPESAGGTTPTPDAPS